MRSSTLTRTSFPFDHSSITSTPPLTQVPSIRLTTATPSAPDTLTKTRPPTMTILAPKAESNTRKRLVPKKSKLSLLGGSRRERGSDLSDVAHRVGATSPPPRNFEIYVDPADDPDIGEIVVLRKKKSRVGLNELHWGALNDVTNTGKEQAVDDGNDLKKPPPTQPTKAKPKDDEKEKRWTIRGRKDSKMSQKKVRLMKSKEMLRQPSQETLRATTKGRTKSSKETFKGTTKESTKESTKTRKPLPFGQSKDSDRRQRSASLDAGMVFSSTLHPINTNCISVPMPDDDEMTPRRGHVRTNTSPSLFSERPATLQGIAAVTQSPKAEEKPKNGSIALRAIRSVRSLARIGSWAQHKNMPADDDDDDPPVKKVKDKPEKREKRKKERTASISKSSFEALKNTFGSIRRSSTSLSGTLRSVSSQATAVSSSSDGTIRHTRRQSAASMSSTVLYDSPTTVVADSVRSRAPKSSTGSSIRWDDTVKEQKTSMSPKETKKTAGSKRRSPGGRKRPGLAALFPDLTDDAPDKLDPTSAASEICPEASETPATVLDMSGVTALDSPSRRVRPRPVSEQMLGRARPRGVIGDKDTGVIRLLDNATTDLACLIDRLDLSATPTSSSVDVTPRPGAIASSRVNRMEAENAVKKPARQLSMEKLLGSFRSYKNRRKALSTSAADTLGQRIAPWPDSDSSGRSTAQPNARQEEKVYLRSASPPAPYEPSPEVHPLPAPSRPVSVGSLERRQDEPHILEAEPVLPASFATFGKKQSSGTDNPTSLTNGRRSRAGRGSSASQNALILEAADDVILDVKARLARAKRSTLGSVGSQSSSFDAEDPDSDIPRELRMLLNRESNRNSSYAPSAYRGKLSSGSNRLPPSRGTPPHEPLPPVQSPEADIRPQISCGLSDFSDNAFIASSDEDENDTKKSFDFTTELRNLGCSGDTDKSFESQLEEAFKTPRKYSIRGLGSTLGLGVMDSPDISAVFEERRIAVPAHEVALPDSPTASMAASEEDCTETSVSESNWDRTYDEDICIKQPLHTASRATFSKPSLGSLDLNFKFGGDASGYSQARKSSKQLVNHSDGVSHHEAESRRQSPSSLGSVQHEELKEMRDFISPLTDKQGNSTTSNNPMILSDVIPPPDHETRRYSYCSLNEDESAMLRLILERAANIPNDSPSVDSDRALTRSCRYKALDRVVTHSRQNSDNSFSGLSTYSGIRRGFEFGTSRPAFYPLNAPTANNSLLVPNTAWRNSIRSLGSVSSYGRITRDGAKDPFDFPVPGRRISEDMSYTVEDTFSFLHQDPMRRRVESGSSSYSLESQYSHIRPDALQRRSRRQVESIVSVTSGPPISLYNRGFTAGRATVSWRQRNSSYESVASGFSAHRLGRPGVGDKMFESACGVPLSSISASPSQVDASADWRSEYDSVVDDYRDQDSLFDGTRRRSFMSTQESLFGRDNRHPGPFVPPRFRPLSIYSFETQESTKRDTDTIISMLDGGFVRRRSLRSTLENSPCARMEKRHQKQRLGKVLTRLPSKDDYDRSVDGSPDKARLISRPSFASVYNRNLDSGSVADLGARLARKQSPSSARDSIADDRCMTGAAEENPEMSRLSAYDAHAHAHAHFGNDRMDLAQKGLLERRSLEDCCLSAEGEDVTNTGQTSLVVFRRPERAARKRGGSTGQETTMSGADTPPLSRSRSSTHFTGSQGSIDLDRLNVILSNSTDPVGYDKAARLRRRGSGHRRRINEARASRASSVYETIEEAPELLDGASFDGNLPKHSLESTVTQNSSVSDVNIVRWEHDDVGPALRMMRELQDEVRLAVDASRRKWSDTAYSIDAVQSFRPPNDPSDWEALLEHSLKQYGPLPPELQGCSRRSRKISRPSPYPRVRVFTRPPTDQPPVPSISVPIPDTKAAGQGSRVFMKVNGEETVRRFGPVFKFMKPAASSGEDKRKSKEAESSGKNALQPIGTSRSSMLSTARKLVAGPAKRHVAKSPRKDKQNKENAGQGTSIKADSLRISRPRPMGRPSAVPRSIRF